MVSILELEALRKKTVQKVWIGLILGSLFVIFPFFYLSFPDFSGVDHFTRGHILDYYLKFYCCCCGLGILVAIAVSRKAYMNYASLYKKSLVQRAFQNKFTNVYYEPQKGIALQDVIESKVLDTRFLEKMGKNITSSYYRSKDYVTGEYKGVSFLFSELMIKNIRHERIFNGQWFVFDFHKPFAGEIQVYDTYGYRSIHEWDQKDFVKVELEDVDFQEKFLVYSKQEIDAFYILTPQVIEQIKLLNDKISGNLLFSFSQGKLSIGLSQHESMFEPKVFEKVNLEEMEQRIQSEIALICDFVDIFKLDNSYFKGGKHE